MDSAAQETTRLKGPALVALGAAGWGTENLFRRQLTARLAPYPIVLWGFATAAGRGAMRELPLGLAAPLRLWAGLATTAAVLGLRVLAGKGGFGFAALNDWATARSLLLLTSVSGVLPLFVYFAG